MNNREYEITWYTQEKKSLLNELLIEEMTSSLQKIGAEIDVTLSLKTASVNHVSYILSGKYELNLNKVLRTLEKKMTSITACKGLEVGGGRNKSTRILSFAQGQAKEDGRLKKLIQGIVDVGYYDLHEFFSGDLEAFKTYLGEKKLGIVELGQCIFLVDLEGLNHKINLNCFECTKKHQYGCCCGSPCDMSRRNKERFDIYENEIAKEVKELDEKTYGMIQQTGGFVFLDGTINECNGHCALLVKHEGSYKCIAHKYALDHEMPIYNICPLSCLMYPLEMMTLISHNQDRRVILLTSAIKEGFAKEFSRWGSYESLEVELRCINESLHNEVFKQSDYKPIYKVNKGLFEHEFGEAVYEGICSLCKK